MSYKYFKIVDITFNSKDYDFILSQPDFTSKFTFNNNSVFFSKQFKNQEEIETYKKLVNNRGHEVDIYDSWEQYW